MKKFLIIILPFLIFCSCKDPYPNGHYPTDVTNFTAVNSQYDDYNSDLKVVSSGFFLCFSTNRHSNGDNFDIVEYYTNFEWRTKTGVLSLYVSAEIQGTQLSHLVNTSNNELGPYSVDIPDSPLFLFANDDNGNYDIKYLWDNKISDVAFLNTEANELYPSFYGKDVYFANRNNDFRKQYVNKIEKIIYCSDKDGKYDIYEINLPKNTNIVDIIQSSEPYPSVKLPINSSYDDKCPFVNGNLLVFSSNRPGGYGGYDLYYSIYQDEKWGEPVNFGEKINSEYDEYRPITHYESNFDNNLMIFSSNRPEGLGGFDLYYVGISKNIKIR